MNRENNKLIKTNESLQTNHNSDEIINEILLPQQAFSSRLFGAGIKVYYVSDIHLHHHFNDSTPIEKQIENIVKGMFNKELIEDIKERSVFRELMIIIAGDTSHNFKTAKCFYHFFKEKYIFYMKKAWENAHEDYGEITDNCLEADDLPIYVVLGNHELCEFDKVEKSAKEYRDFLSSEGIHFLHNEAIEKSNYIIYGGIGFAKHNPVYNSETIITTTPPITRQEEAIQTDRFYSGYLECLKIAKEKSKHLIVIAHYPVKDWLEKEQTDSICTYFTGHTHYNNSEHTLTADIYSDNQIGYKKIIKFKSTNLGTIYNPFTEYKDGYFEIKPEQYKKFILFCGDKMQGTGLIEKQLLIDNTKFYMIKQKGFYGFFVINFKTGTKICAGGRIKNISKNTDINHFYRVFLNMVATYANALKPYREVQEEFAENLKALGYSGKIHGCIVDIDYYNHIMINPLDGKITYYYSSSYGIVRPYGSFTEMLNDRKTNEVYLPDKKAWNNIKSRSALICKRENEIEEYIGKTVKVRTKESAYDLSMRIKQLQRIFDSNVLRDWNDDWAEGKEDSTGFIGNQYNQIEGL